MLNFAIQTAREVGAILTDRLGRALQISNKGDIDLVTEADLASEKLIGERIRSHYPRHAILAEESGASDGVELVPRKAIGSGLSIRLTNFDELRARLSVFLCLNCSRARRCD